MATGAAATSDAIIYLPGIMGSELVDADGKVRWGARLGVGVRQVFLRDVFERLEPRPGDGITASQPIRFPTMIPLLSSAEPYTNLDRRLRDVAIDPEAVLAFPYDWRHSITAAADALAPVARAHLESWRARFAALDPERRRGLPEPGLTLVGHSMGGLVASWFATHHRDRGGADVRRIITLGTPFRGSLNAIRVLATGEKLPFGLFADSLRSAARRMPGLYELIASYACLDEPGAERPRRLTPADVAAVGGSAELAEEALATIDALHGAWDVIPDGTVHCLVGSSQPTLQSVSITDGIPTFREDVADRDGYRADFGGDGTVFRYSATPTGVTGLPVPQSHGALARSTEGTEFATAMATLREPGRFQGDADVGVRVPELALAGRAFEVGVTASTAASVTVQVHDAETNALVTIATRPLRDGAATLDITVPTPGLHRISVPAGGFSPIERLVLVVAP